MAAVTIQAKPKGPNKVSGQVEIVIIDVGGSRKTIEVGQAVDICRCGCSTHKPYCDGSHKRWGFKDD